MCGFVVAVTFCHFTFIVGCLAVCACVYKHYALLAA